MGIMEKLAAEEERAVLRGERPERKPLDLPVCCDSCEERFNLRTGYLHRRKNGRLEALCEECGLSRGFLPVVEMKESEIRQFKKKGELRGNARQSDRERR